MKIEKNDLVVETFPIGTYACNCSLIYSLRSKEAIIIDPGNDFFALKNLIDERGLKVGKLLHTHAHFDHIGRSCDCKDYTGAELFLHRDDLFLYRDLSLQGSFFGQSVSEASYAIDFYLEQDMDLGLGKEVCSFLKTLHTPGHTPGSCCFYSDYFDEPLLFSGDTLFSQSIGRVDLPGGDGDKILRSIKKDLFTLPAETVVITGHGSMTQIGFEKKHNPFVGP